MIEYFYGQAFLGADSGLENKPQTGDLVHLMGKWWRVIEIRFHKPALCKVFCTVPTSLPSQFL